MSKQGNSAIDRDRLPFVAPCRELSPWAPFRWIRLGVADLVRAPRQSLVYGLAVAVLIGAVSMAAWFRGSQWIMFGMLGGFVFLAPLTCVGLYAISAQLERGQEPALARSFRAAFKRHIGNEAVFALVLLVIFLVWSRAAVIVTAVMYPTDGNPTTAELISFLTFGSGVGAIFAAVTFSASAFSLPMIMHRDVDSVTAIVTSVIVMCSLKFSKVTRYLVVNPNSVALSLPSSSGVRSRLGLAGSDSAGIDSCGTFSSSGGDAAGSSATGAAAGNLLRQLAMIAFAATSLDTPFRDSRMHSS